MAESTTTTHAANTGEDGDSYVVMPRGESAVTVFSDGSYTAWVPKAARAALAGWRYGACLLGMLSLALGAGVMPDLGTDAVLDALGVDGLLAALAV